MASVTPMMQQYLLLKEEYKDCLLFYRLGDFYEMFFDDAITASRELDLTLTGRDCGLEERAPMCGVPHHSVEGYINRLLQKGYRIAICEQMSDPIESKGLVEREVTRVITPGTVIEDALLEEARNNYLVSVCKRGKMAGLASVDVSTGEFVLTQMQGEEYMSDLLNELIRLQPAEILANEEMLQWRQAEGAEAFTSFVPLYAFPAWAFEQKSATTTLLMHFRVASLDGYGCADMALGISAAGALIEYLRSTQKNALSHINEIRVLHKSEFMVLDETTRRNLELTQSLHGSGRRATLLALLNKTCTAMGGRKLRQWIEQPLQSLEGIECRQTGVGELVRDTMMRDVLRDSLKRVYDIERLATRVAYGTIHARDCLSLQQSLEQLPALKCAIARATSPMLQALHDAIDTSEDLSSLLLRAVAPEPPLSLKDGGIIRDGYHEGLDQLRQAATGGKEWIAELEAREREETGIRTLKIGFNRVFGYYMEVSKSYLNQVPYRYIRRQTLANAERFITPELKEFEDTVLGAEEKSVKLEYRLFTELRDMLQRDLHRLQSNAKAVAELDTLQSLASAAVQHEYVCPAMHDDGCLRIVDGRHPVVEKMLPDGEAFVPNDTELDGDNNRLMIITGPNMAGKSTYMRQVALITLMAHIGSFVPARQADICLVDRVFTRVGASDDLARGKSTFMVEMSEMANILHNATEKSLLLLDEIGRGTSTFDGLSIAWSIMEYLSEKLACKALFSTHYHELSELEGCCHGVVNFRVLVREMGDTIIFLRRVVRGEADKSFGIQVARLAGLPPHVIKRALEILHQLEEADINKSALSGKLSAAQKKKAPQVQVDIFSSRSQALLEQIRALDMDNLTPKQALNTLFELYDQAQKT